MLYCQTESVLFASGLTCTTWTLNAVYRFSSKIRKQRQFLMYPLTWKKNDRPLFSDAEILNCIPAGLSPSGPKSDARSRRVSEITNQYLINFAVEYYSPDKSRTYVCIWPLRGDRHVRVYQRHTHILRVASSANSGVIVCEIRVFFKSGNYKSLHLFILLFYIVDLSNSFFKKGMDKEIYFL